MTDNAQLINQDSGDVEYGTPAYIVEAARRVMGQIELDPASCARANQIVRAARYFSREDDGLAHFWETPALWMNHPFSRTNNPLFIGKLVAEFENGAVEQACAITFANTSEKWFQWLLAYPVCFISPRVNYYPLTEKKVTGATKGSAVAYLGPNHEAFIREFSVLGRVVCPAMPALRRPRHSQTTFAFTSPNTHQSQ